MANQKIQFVLTGFSDFTGSRVFAFEGVAADRSRSPYTVTADLAMARRYGITLQELPLLCRVILDQRHEDGRAVAFTYGEAEMCLYAKDRAAAKQRKPAKRPPTTGTVGSAWRGPFQQPGSGPR